MEKMNESDVLFGGVTTIKHSEGNVVKSFDEIEDAVNGKKVLVFGGFAGLGYDDYDDLNRSISEHLKSEIERHGAENIAVVSGATADGIGRCYQAAKEFNIPTYGIISSAGKSLPIADGCDKVFYVERHHDDWATIDENGHSYLVKLAKNHGKMVYFGGGEGALQEIYEAEELGVETDVHAKFYPNKYNLKTKLSKMTEEERANFDPTPILTYTREKKHKAYADEMIQGYQEILNEKNDMKSGCITMGAVGGGAAVLGGLILGIGTGGTAFLALGVGAFVANKLWNNHKYQFEKKEESYLERNAHEIPELNDALNKIRQIRGQSIKPVEVQNHGRSFPLA